MYGDCWCYVRYIGAVGQAGFHRIYQPSPDEPLDFEATIERTLLELKQRFQLGTVLTDPYQMASTMQRLLQAGVPIAEFPQRSREPYGR